MHDIKVRPRGAKQWSSQCRCIFC